jgi:hypothetical protein
MTQANRQVRSRDIRQAEQIEQTALFAVLDDVYIIKSLLFYKMTKIN